MITLRRTNNVDLVKGIYGSEGCRELLDFDVHIHNYSLSYGTVYLLICKQSEPVGVFELRPWSSETVELHTCIVKGEWGTGTRAEACEELRKILRESTTFRNIVAYVHDKHKHILNTFKAESAEPLAVIPESNGNIHIVQFSI